MVSNRPICLRCFAYDHHRSECKNDPVISCSKCFGLNYLTRDCCGSPRKPTDEYYQSFRMVGSTDTKFFTDIPIANKMVAGLVDTNRSRTVIDWAVLEKLRTESPTVNYTPPNICSINIPKPHTSVLRTQVVSLPGDLRIVLGMDFLTQRHVELTLKGVKLQPKLNGQFARSPTARYIINLVLASKPIPAVIDTGITQSKMDVSILSFLHCHDSTHHYDHLTRMCQVPVKWKGKEMKMSFRVERSRENQIALGTDFLKKCGFEMILDGVCLNINNPWKTSHQDAIEFVYNQDRGKELERIIRTERLVRNKDTSRPVVASSSDAESKRGIYTDYRFLH